MRRVTWKYNIPLAEPGSLYYSNVNNLEPTSVAHLGAGLEVLGENHTIEER